MKRFFAFALTLTLALTFCACGGSTNLYYVVGKSGDWCMIVGAGSRISRSMEEALEQPSVEGGEIQALKVEFDDCVEIPESIDGIPVTDIEGWDFGGLKGVKYVALPEDVFPEWELDPDVIYIVHPGSEAEERAERFGCQYMTYAQYVDLHH